MWGVVSFCINTARDWNSFVRYPETEMLRSTPVLGHINCGEIMNHVECLYMFFWTFGKTLLLGFHVGTIPRNMANDEFITQVDSLHHSWPLPVTKAY